MGKCFIEYSRRLWDIERMVERIFVGVPVGMYDQILDFSRPVTRTTFFAPSAGFLAGLGG